MIDDRAEKLFGDYPETVRERFKIFHSKNQHVYNLFANKAVQILRTGRTKYSARTIFESIRWDYDTSTTGDVFEINGDFVPMYARLLIYHKPEFDNFFELRRVRSKGIKSEEQIHRESSI